MRKKLKNFRYKIFLLLFDRERKTTFQAQQKILFSHLHNFLGDTIISTYIYPILKQNGYEVHTLSQDRNACILENDESLTKNFRLKKNFFQQVKTLFQLNKENYDLVVIMNEHSFKRKQLPFYSFLKARNILSFNLDLKLINIKLSCKNEKHIMERYEILLKFLKIKPPKIQYFLKIPEKIQQEVQTFLKENNYKDFIVLNPYGSIKTKKFTQEQSQAIITFFLKKKQKIIIIGKPKELRSLAQKAVLLNPFEDFLYSVEILRNSKFLISPDTSFVHAASAFNLPQLACYRDEASSILWKAQGENAHLLFSEEGSLSFIKVERILEELEKFSF